MPAILYLASALAVLWATRRWILPLSPRASLALVAFPLLFTGRALVTGAAYAPIDLPFATEPLSMMRSQVGLDDLHSNFTLNDIYTQMIPYRQAVREAIRHGEWPLWNRYTACGDVLAASAQPAAFSPFTLIALLCPVVTGFTFTASIFYFIAGLGAFLFARLIGCRESAAAFAAAGWMFASAIAFFILWPIGESWALLPFVLVAVRQIVVTPGIRTTAVLTAVLAQLVLAGHPETLLHVVAIGALWGVFELARRRRAIRRALGAAGVAGLLALAITAIDLLPILEAMPQTREGMDRKDILASNPPRHNGEEMLVRLALDLMPQFNTRFWRLRHVRQLPPDSAAVGSIVLAAAIYAIRRVRSGETSFLIGLLVFGILVHLQWAPLSIALRKLPLFDIALNERFCYAAAFAFVALGARGIEELSRRNDRAPFAISAAAVLVLITTAAVVIERSGIVSPNVDEFARFRMFADIAMLALAVLAVVARIPVRALVPALVALVLLQRTIQESGIYPTLPADAAYPRVPLFAPMQTAQSPFRITASGLGFIPGTAALYGLEDVRGYAAMTLRRYEQTWPLWCIEQPVWFNRTDDLSRPFLSFLNVRYAIAHQGTTVPAGWHEVAQFRRVGLLRNDHALERAFVPATVKLGYGDGDALLEMERETDFARQAWIRVSNAVPQQRTNGPGRLRIDRRKLGIDLDAVMARDGWIVVSEPDWKGWRAYVDGRRVEHQIADIAFLGIFVPKGHHHVRLVYWSQAFVVGRTITFATIVLIATASLLQRHFRRRRDRA